VRGKCHWSECSPERLSALLAGRGASACALFGSCWHVVPGGLPTELFIAWIIVAKFGDHLPFYRQAEIFKRQGIDLDRGTLGNWVGRAFRGLTPPHWGDIPPQLHLMPVINQMRAHLRRADRIFVDETRAPVLDPGRTRPPRAATSGL